MSDIDSKKFVRLCELLARIHADVRAYGVAPAGYAREYPSSWTFETAACVPPRVCEEIRQVGYRHLLKKLEGLGLISRDNMLSAHALYTDVVQSIKNEIEYPTI